MAKIILHRKESFQEYLDRNSIPYKIDEEKHTLEIDQEALTEDQKRTVRLGSMLTGR